MRRLHRQSCVLSAGLMALALILPQSGAAQDLAYTTSWLGNSFSGHDRQWVQNNVDALVVAPDGTIYANSIWDESGREVGIYRDGAALPFDAGVHGWGRLGGHAITLDDRYLYITMQQSGCDGGNDDLNSNGLRAYPTCSDEGQGPIWHALRRYDLTTLAPVPFPGGYGHDGTMLVVAIAPATLTGETPLTGLAVHDGAIHVSSTLTDSIKVYDAETLAFLRTIPVANPDEIALDAEGGLWVIQTAPAGLLRLTETGTIHPEQLPIGPTVRPVALAFDSAGRLLIADDGPDQNVKFFADGPDGWAQVDTLGEPGGVFADPPGATGPLRFHNLRGVGVDPAGRITVGFGGYLGTEIRSFAPDRTLLWEVFGLTFLDTPAADPASDGREVHTKDSQFTMDYTLPPGQQAQYHSVTLDPFRFPDDPRLHLDSASVLMRRIDGQPLMFVIGMYSGELQVYRFDPANLGPIAIPSVLFTTTPIEGDWQPAGQPQEGATIWRDINGDGGFDPGEYEPAYDDNPFVWGWWVDDLGTVWRANRENGLRAFPLQGFDAFGNPVYSLETSQVIPAPPPYDIDGDINRIMYLAAEDQMILSGYTAAAPNPAQDWGQVGRVIHIYDGWTAAGPEARTPDREIVLVYGPDDPPKAMAVAGDYIFVGYTYDARIEVFDRHTAALRGTLAPDATVGGISGWLDLPYAISAVQRADGEYVVFAEDDAFAKIIIYRFRP